MTDAAPHQSPSALARAVECLYRLGTMLTRERVRVHAVMLCIGVIVLNVLNMATPTLFDRAGHLKFADFMHFYILGTIATSGQADALYDDEAQAQLSVELVPESKGFFYLPAYGPQVSLFFAPLSRMAFLWAALTWVLISAIAYTVCCHAVWRSCPNLRRDGPIIVILAIGFPALVNVLAHGQNSCIALVSLTAAYFALKHSKPLIAGLAIGMLMYKPQLGLVAAVAFTLNFHWRVVIGAVIAGGAQLAAGWMYYGTPVMIEYFNTLLLVGEDDSVLAVRPFQMHNLLGFWSLLLPWKNVALVAYALSAIAVLATTVAAWRNDAALSLRFALLVLATVLVSPYLRIYDLVILAPALLLVGDWALGNQRHRLAFAVRPLLYLVFALPLFGAATQFTHVQLSVIAMTALMAMVAHVILKPEPVETHKLRDALMHES